MKKKLLLISAFIFNAFIVNAQCPQITCPGAITAITAPGSCDAVVTYTAPQGTDPCALGSQTFNYTGSLQTFIVPAGVTSLDIDIAGAQGGNAVGNAVGWQSGAVNIMGGRGGRVTATLAVTPGETLNLYIGGQGTLSAGGYNGGGAPAGCSGTEVIAAGGGGASDIRQGGALLGDRVIIAGGGGGAAGSPSVSYQTIDYSPAGGGLIAASTAIASTSDCVIGIGGSQVAGGTGGNNSCWCSNNDVAASGSLGIGGSSICAASGLSTCSCSGTGCTSGGGGGGGYYGGGAGISYAGGGGGSSFSGTGATNVVHTQGYQDINGFVTISWSNGTAPTTAQIAGLASGATFPLGTTVNTFQTTDGFGNTANCSFNIIVVDNEAPVANSTTLTDITAECEVTTLVAPTATDNCSGQLQGTHNAVLPIAANTTITWTYDDGNGNTSTQTQNVVITGLNLSVGMNEVTLMANNSGPGVSYQWINCGNGQIVNGATNQSYTATVNGDFAVIITDGSCSDTSACSSITTVGINENLLSGKVSVYPNPTEGFLQMDLGFVVSQALIQIRDIQGRLIAEMPVANKRKVNVTIDQAPGLYFFHIISENGNAVVRVAKTE